MLVLAFSLLLSGWSVAALAEPVDMELVLLADVSGSIDETEFQLQKQGYADAFRDADIINGITDTRNGRVGAIAVTLVYWSEGQLQSLGWTRIDSAASSRAFADAILATSRPASVGLQTHLAAAMTAAGALFQGNGFESDRRVIDISGDGVENGAGDVATARDHLLAAGVRTINGIVIGDRELLKFYENEVIGGKGKFVKQVTDYRDFSKRMREKVAAEVNIVNNVVVLTPVTRIVPTGANVTVSANLKEINTSTPLANTLVRFAVLSGPNFGAGGSCAEDPNCLTDANGNVSFTYAGNGGVGEDVVQACFDDEVTSAMQCSLSRVTWVAASSDQSITLDPVSSSGPAGVAHTVAATVLQGADLHPLEGTTVSFEVIDGPDKGGNARVVTDASGVARFTYQGGGAGTDTIRACFQTQTMAQAQCAESTRVWALSAGRIDLRPDSDSRTIGTTHIVTASLNDTELEVPLNGAAVTFRILSGPNKNANGVCASNVDCATDNNGNVSFSYQGAGGVGEDRIQACFTDQTGTERCAESTIRWIDPASPVDSDGDGLSDAREAELGTDPQQADTDGDTLSDGREAGVNGTGTNPLLKDTDGDGLDDGVEVNGQPTPTNPLKADTDGDGKNDGEEDLNHNGRVDSGETDPRTPDSAVLGNEGGKKLITNLKGGAGAFGLPMLGLLGLLKLLGRRRIWPMLSLALLASGSTMAAEGDLYLGLGAGVTRVSPDENNSGYKVTDDSDSGVKVFLGYEFSDHVGVEGYFSKLGSAKIGGIGQGAIDYGVFGLEGVVRTSTFGQGVRAFGKLGVGNVDTSSSSVPFLERNSSQITLGAGLEKRFSQGFSLRGEYQYFDKDAQLLSISAVKHFNPPAPSPVVIHEPAQPVVVQAAPEAPADSDVDGVPDQFDRCPHTPVGEQVDGSGCPIDRDHDGVLNANDKCPDTTPGERVDQDGCTLVQHFTGVLEGVNFYLDSDRLTGEAQSILNNVASDLLNHPTIHVLIVGHTDNLGSAAYNKDLSLRRARAVARYLLKQGVPAYRMRYAGMGEEKPIASNATEEGRAKNRRVEFIARDMGE